MTVQELQKKLLNLQYEGLRWQQMCTLYPGISISFIPGYDAWLNNLYQYEQKYLKGHHTHTQFLSYFGAAGDPRTRLDQLLEWLDVVNKDQLFWEDLKHRGLNCFEEGTVAKERNVEINLNDNMPDAKPSVFISYNWGSDNIAKEVESKLKLIAEVHRDKRSIESWGSITEFMKNIRKTDLVVIIISDSYLKSVACMYEVIQLLKDENWISHTMFLVEESAKGIYRPVGQLKYVKYWIDEVNDLKNELKGIDYALVTSQAEELKKIEFIQLHINDFMKTVADRNNPDLSQAIDDVVRRVQGEQR
jgi:hypothetical protein